MSDPFWVWAVDDGERPEKANVLAMNEEEAALIFVERNHARLDYTCECEIRVEDQEGHRFELRVEVESQPVFRIAGRR